MLTFTDEYTRKVSLYFLAKKSDAFTAYKQFKAWVSAHQKGTIKVLRTDHSGKYMLHAFTKHLSDSGTEHELTVHNSPSQNSVAECLNRTLVTRACTCMIEANDLPCFLWAEALQYTAWTKNRTPTRTLTNKTLHEMVTCYDTLLISLIVRVPSFTHAQDSFLLSSLLMMRPYDASFIMQTFLLI